MIWILACTDPVLSYRTGIAADTPYQEALAACGNAGEDADECTATAARNHPQDALQLGNGHDPCATITSSRWRAECRFSLAESLATSGNRWGALAGCGQAGRFYDECLYHAWTFELQAHAENLGQAWKGVDGVRDTIAFWSGIQTVQPTPEDLLWRDWWYFAHTRNKPARLSGCSNLQNPDDVRHCMEGTTGYVLRTVAETVARAATPQKDRVCRAGIEEALKLTNGAWDPDPSLEAAAQEGLRIGCQTGQAGKSAENGNLENKNLEKRPWNPIFGPRNTAGPKPPHGPG